MKKIFLFVIIICMLLSGCTKKEESTIKNEKPETISDVINEEDGFTEVELSFAGPNDPKLLSYIENDVRSGIVDKLENEDYIIENVQAVYLSDEYIEELSYNSKENVFFGYTLSDLDDRFGDKKFCFTLGDDGTTIVKEFEGHDDSVERMIKNVAIGTGVIVVCVVVTYATAGAATGPVLHTVNSMFTMAAADSIKFAALGTPIGAIAGGVTEAIKNENSDISDILKASLLGATEGYKIGAIVGAAEGATRSAISQYLPKYKELKAIETALKDPNVPLWRKAELRALKEYGGREQIAYLAGQEVAAGTPGATVPDVIYNIGDVLEAVEVKYYNLESSQSLETLFRELTREVSSRVVNLPEGTLQRIVLDVTDRGFTKELVDSVSAKIVEVLMPVYQNIPITIVGL